MVYKIYKENRLIHTTRTLSAADKYLNKRKDFLRDSRDFAIQKTIRKPKKRR